MRLVLYGASLKGHHGSYMLRIADAASARNWNVVLLVPVSEKTNALVNAFVRLLGPGNVVFSPHICNCPLKSDPLSLISYHISQHAAAKSSFAYLRREADAVYVANLDYMDKAIQIMGSPFHPVPLGGMCMRARFHMKEMGIRSETGTVPTSLSYLAFRGLLRVRGVSLITTADPTLAKFCSDRKSDAFKKVKYIPELGMSPIKGGAAQARSNFGLSVADEVILIYGAITRRKGVRQCLEALALQGARTTIKLLVVGEVDSEMESQFKSAEMQAFEKSGHLVLSLGLASELRERSAFAAADAVWVAYENHDTMSGVFYQAVCNGRPVISGRSGLLNWLTTTEGVGICVNPADAQETASLLLTLFRDRVAYSRYQENALRIAHLHYPENFGKAVCDEIAGTTINPSGVVS